MDARDTGDPTEESQKAAIDVEVPEADAVEQQQDVGEPGDDHPTAVPLDADEYDAAEQSRVVELDEDDYR